MEVILVNALKLITDPMTLIILTLIAKDFYGQRTSAQQIANDASTLKTLELLKDSVAQLCTRIDRLIDRGH